MSRVNHLGLRNGFPFVIPTNAEYWDEETKSYSSPDNPDGVTWTPKAAKDGNILVGPNTDNPLGLPLSAAILMYWRAKAFICAASTTGGAWALAPKTNWTGGLWHRSDSTHPDPYWETVSGSAAQVYLVTYAATGYSESVKRDPLAEIQLLTLTPYPLYFQSVLTAANPVPDTVSSDSSPADVGKNGFGGASLFATIHQDNPYLTLGTAPVAFFDDLYWFPVSASGTVSAEARVESIDAYPASPMLVTSVDGMMTAKAYSAIGEWITDETCVKNAATVVLDIPGGPFTAYLIGSVTNSHSLLGGGNQPNSTPVCGCDIFPSFLVSVDEYFTYDGLWDADSGGWLG